MSDKLSKVLSEIEESGTELPAGPVKSGWVEHGKIIRGTTVIEHLNIAMAVRAAMDRHQFALLDAPGADPGAVKEMVFDVVNKVIKKDADVRTAEANS